MKVRREWRRIDHHNGRSSRSAGFDLVRNDGNAGLWFHSIGTLGRVYLSVPLGLLMVDAEKPWRHSRHWHGRAVLDMRWFMVEFRIGKRPERR